MASLTEEARLRVVAERERYTIDGEPCAALLYETIMNLAIINNCVTSKHFRANLKNLATYMTTICSDIEKFNQYVKENYNSLRARGDDVDSLLACLFDGYWVAADHEFRTYINKKRDE